MRAVKIALPVPAGQLFSYLVPLGYGSAELRGRRALVPFGERTMTGIIVGDDTITKERTLKRVLEIFDDKPIFSDTMLEFTKWISEYYLSSWGETLRAALPQGMSPQSVIKAQIIREPTPEELEQMLKRAPKRAALLKTLINTSTPVSVNYLESLLNAKTIALQLESLENSGYILCEKLTEKDLQPKFQKALSINLELANDNALFRKELDKMDKSAPKQSLLLSYIFLLQKNNPEPVIMAQALRETESSSSVIDALVKKGFLKVEDVEIDRGKQEIEAVSLAQRDETLLSLTDEQEAALGAISQILEKGAYEPFLLHGITGSGKTLVYLHSIRKALELGKTALVLLPEISLTPQMIDRFQAVFPSQLAVLHSKMSQGQRYDSWRSILHGKAKIVIGARSAIFAPLRYLGLIIVDEEHESSYKQQSPQPRYNARDCAIVRARKENCALVLGSATPSLESYYNAMQGRYKLLKIESRADNAKMPAIKIIDTISARKAGQFKGSFALELIDAISLRLKKKEGVILLQNRRGFSSYLECKDCGFVPMCKNCSVSMTYHKRGARLKCHYCGFTTEPEKSCPSCGHPELSEIGFGTQRIEDELTELLAERDMKAVIERMDFDSTSKKGSHRRILTNFSNGTTDILLGTQMVAKGLDFDRVTLVGVVNADIQLFIPDFRSSERTFQLLTQVAGRAGRTSDKAGEVIIQTAQPGNFAISSAKSGSYNSFYEIEINNRKTAQYPPFVRFVVIEFSGGDENEVHGNALRFNGLLRATDAIKILGPVEPAIARLRGNFRRITILKNIKSADPSGAALRQALCFAVEEYKKKFSKSSVKVTIDIDSYSGI